MPRDVDQAWEEVGRQVGELGSRIHEHYRHQVEGRGQPVERTGQAMSDALEMLSRQIGSAVDAMGEAFRDQVVREHALQASRAFADAVEVSVADLSGRVRKARKRSPRRRDR
ncbi:MAG: hypothetical protein ABSH07_03725 [Candidatus Dormibacteria bacterium]|jgi:hypothetical protein